MKEYEKDNKLEFSKIDDIFHMMSIMDQAEDKRELVKMIPDLLRLIGEYTKAGRTYIFDWSAEKNSFCNTFEWCAQGVVPQIGELQEVSVEDMPGRIRSNLRTIKRLQDALEDARAASAARMDFLRYMSHDIRTPINGIMGMLAMEDRYSEDVEKLKECRSKIKEAMGFLQDLVDSVLDISRLESGAIVLDHVPFDICALSNDVFNIIEMNGKLRKVKVTFYTDKIVHSKLKGSPVHLKQILMNIAGNAVKYNRIGGSVALHMEEISSDDKSVVYRFMCSDTGRGMSQEFVKQAFEPFTQEKSDARSSYMGTGLGLAITKQLVELMHGEIELTSQLHVGSIFTITIPFELADEAENAELDKDESSDDRIRGLKVLIAEDNELNQEIAKFLFEEEGMEVTLAADGQEAVEYIAKPLDMKLIKRIIKKYV